MLKLIFIGSRMQFLFATFRINCYFWRDKLFVGEQTN